MVVVPPLVRAHRFGFGGESPLDNWFADITANRDPAVVFPFDRECSTYWRVPLGELDRYRPMARFRHSRFYLSEAVIAFIADRLNAVAAQPGAQPSSGP